MSAAKPFNVYTEVSAGHPVVTLADGERVISIALEADGTNIATVRVVCANTDFSDVASVSGTLEQEWDGLLRGPGTISFGNLGAGHYVVTTEKP